MVIELEWQGKKFTPSVYGLKNNFIFTPEPEIMKIIKEKAFLKSWQVSLVGDVVVRRTLASGVCSGISAYVLLNFLGEEIPSAQEEIKIAVMQVRTWGRPFLTQSLKSYFNNKKFKEKLEKSLRTTNQEWLPLVVFLPKISNLKKITYAHTVVPYSLEEGLRWVKIKVYDSNYPGNNNLVLKIDKLEGTWDYRDKGGNRWILTINYLGNLLKRVPFLW